MKAKLRKDKDHYRLFVEDKQIGSTGTRVPSKEMYLLSFENCDSLFGIFDVDKLAEESKNEYVKRFNNISKSDYMNGFEEGFNKAMELNKDKVFTLSDISYAISFSGKMKPSEIVRNLLQQPTEIEVEIEMEVVPDFYSRSDEDGSIFTSNKKEQPKLDSSGCLILTKKI